MHLRGWLNIIISVRCPVTSQLYSVIIGSARFCLIHSIQLPIVGLTVASRGRLRAIVRAILRYRHCFFFITRSVCVYVISVSRLAWLPISVLKKKVIVRIYRLNKCEILLLNFIINEFIELLLRTLMSVAWYFYFKMLIESSQLSNKLSNWGRPELETVWVNLWDL